MVGLRGLLGEFGGVSVKITAEENAPVLQGVRQKKIVDYHCSV